jgi:NAD(P)H-hydrate epimerase
LSFSALPTLTSGQVKEADSLAQERFGVPVEWLMEAAGWQLARFADGPAAVVCGVGNNAGDGLAMARHLHRWGRLASVCCVDATRFKGEASRELDALRRLGVAISIDLRLDDATLVVDAIFGTGLSRAPEGRFADWIEAINASGKRVVAVDLPSGLDADTGLAYAPTVRADVTVTFGLPKPGLMQKDGPRASGEVWVVDIGVPFEAYEAVGVKVPAGLFKSGDRFRL